MIPGETAVEKPVLQLNRVIAAPRERGFTAWTTLDAIKVWFRPGAVGTSLVTVQSIPGRQSNGNSSYAQQIPGIEAPDDHGHSWNGTFDKLERYLLH
jgi:uncharacterized protein YndB with AHSA1/START domain